MEKAIAIMGTLDTKGDQLEYLRDLIHQKGIETITIDVGVLGEPTFHPDIDKHQVAQAAGVSLEQVIEEGRKSLKEGGSGSSASMDRMTEGAFLILKELHAQGRLGGIISVGGTLGTALTLNVLNALPMVMPKLVLSTIANSPGIDPDLVSNNVMMMPWIGGLWGINRIAKFVLSQAASYMVAAVETYETHEITKKGEKVVAITSLGMTACRYLYHLRPMLHEKGFDAAVFHSAGGGRLFEKSVEAGWFDFVLDLFAGAELLNELGGSLLSPGPHRLEAAVKRGVPQIVSLGIMEIFLWGNYKPVPSELSDRFLFRHNSVLGMIPTTRDEKLKMASLMVEKLNKATAPTAVVVPLKPSIGTTQLHLENMEDLDAVRDELRRGLKPEIRYVEVDASTDDKEFTEEVMRLMDEMMV